MIQNSQALQQKPEERTGLFVLDKPAGISSAHALRLIKKKLGPIKLGHAGTLDPLATGLLVVLIGGATRLARFAEAGIKEYSGVLRLGSTTSTDDAEGEILEERAITSSPQQVQAAAASFVGAIDQVPPAVSALKVAGERAYSLVRRGEQPKLAARSVLVESFELQALSMAEHQQGAQLPFEYRYRVRCGPGTYIRALARDLGAALGCGGHIRELRRSASYPFGELDLCTLEQLSWDILRPWLDLFPKMPRIEVDSECARLLQQGNPKAYSLISAQLAGEGRESLVQARYLAYLCPALARTSGLLENVEGRWQIAVNLGPASI
jgi:tRNA pseudouridine55 synthase